MFEIVEVRPELNGTVPTKIKPTSAPMVEGAMLGTRGTRKNVNLLPTSATQKEGEILLTRVQE